MAQKNNNYIRLLSAKLIITGNRSESFYKKNRALPFFASFRLFYTSFFTP